MPTYDYQCEACGHKFEEFQSITAKPLRKCPQCGKNKLKRLIGCGAGLIFKGSGFYQTDYRSESYQKAAQADQANHSDNSSAGSSDKSSTTNAGKNTTTGTSSSTGSANSSSSSSSSATSSGNKG